MTCQLLGLEEEGSLRRGLAWGLFFAAWFWGAAATVVVAVFR